MTLRFRIQLKRAPAHLEIGLRRQAQRLFEAAFADIAPGADRVGDDVDDHDPSLRPPLTAA